MDKNKKINRTALGMAQIAAFEQRLTRLEYKSEFQRVMLDQHLRLLNNWWLNHTSMVSKKQCKADEYGRSRFQVEMPGARSPSIRGRYQLADLEALLISRSRTKPRN